MTIANQVTFAKRFSRTSSNALTMTDTDDVVMTYLNQGVKEFCKKVHGIPKREYVAITPKFDLQTNFAVQLTVVGGVNEMAATDIVVAESEQFSVTGAVAAQHIQTMINAMNVTQLASGSMVVTWDASNWCFYLDAQATSITVGAPDKDTYVDYTDELFGKSGAQATTTWLGVFPDDCTVESNLPTDFLEDTYVEWDRTPLKRAPNDVFLSPQSHGDPIYYGVQADRIRFYPSPDHQGKCYLQYRSMIASVSASDATSTNECSLPTAYHMAPVYYAAALIAQERFEASMANIYRGMFMDHVNDYTVREANQNPSFEAKADPPIVPKVIV